MPAGEVLVEHLDYGYIRACKNENEVAKILGVLRSGVEGSYPELEKCAEDQLAKLNPKHRALRKSEPVLKASSLGQKVNFSVKLCLTY